MGKKIKWTSDEVIVEEILKVMKLLNLDRMPTSTEFKKLGRNDINSIIGKTKKQSGWAKHMGIKLKREVDGDSQTSLGNKYENIVRDKLISMGYSVINMTTRHPYDLLVDGSLKIDVKVANPFKNEKKGGRSCHVMNLEKRYATCDVYIGILLDDRGKIERELVIPSHHIDVTTLQVARVSKYNHYDGKYSILKSMLQNNSAITDEYHHIEYEESLNKKDIFPTWKLDEQKVKEILVLIKEGRTLTSIAKDFDVSIQTISDIKYNKKWKHVSRK